MAMVLDRSALAGAVLVALALSGCSAAPVAPVTDTPTPTATQAEARIFANDDEALVAAKKAYAAFQDMSNRIAADGGVAPERMEAFAAGDALEAEIESLRGIAKRHLQAVGRLKFDSFRLQETDVRSGAVSAYLCLDVSDTDLVDEAGNSIVGSGRRSRLPLAVSFSYYSHVQRLMVTESEIWSGTDFC